MQPWTNEELEQFKKDVDRLTVQFTDMKVYMGKDGFAVREDHATPSAIEKLEAVTLAEAKKRLPEAQFLGLLGFGACWNQT